MTKKELAAKLKAKYPQYASVPDDELVQRVVSKYPQYAAQIDEAAGPTRPVDVSATPEEQRQGFWSDLKNNPLMQGGIGMAKGAYNTLRGAAEAVASNPMTGPINAGQWAAGETTGTIPPRAEPEGPMQKVGYYAERVGEAMLPSGALDKATKGLGAIKTGMATGATEAGIAAVQGDGDPALAGGLGAVLPAGLKATQPVRQWLSETIGPNQIAKLLKPSLTTMRQHGFDPIKTFIDEKIFGGTRASVLKAIQEKASSYTDQLHQALGNFADQPVVPMKGLIDAWGKTIEAMTMLGKYGKKGATNPQAHMIDNAAEALQDEILRRTNQTGVMTPMQATEFKRDLGELVRKWGKGPEDASTDAFMQQVYREIDSAIDAAAPGSRELNQKISNLLLGREALQDEIYKRAVREHQVWTPVNEAINAPGLHIGLQRITGTLPQGSGVVPGIGSAAATNQMWDYSRFVGEEDRK